MPRKDWKKTELYKIRKFLNPESEGGIAAIDAKVTTEESSTDFQVSASLGISDCNNGIYLDFDVWDSSEVTKRIRAKRKKIEHVRTIINGYLDAVEQAYQELESKTAEKKAARIAAEKARKAKANKKK